MCQPLLADSISSLPKYFPSLAAPPESVFSKVSRDWLITTPEGVGTAAPTGDVLGTSLVPGAVLGAGL